MNVFEILADSGHDLPKAVAEELGIVTVPLSVTYDENNVFFDGEMDDHEFYEGIRSGKMPKTAAVNPAQWAEKMRPALEEGKDVLVLTISSALSTTYQSAVIAGEELAEQYPHRKILVADTLSASIGEGLLVCRAARMRDGGQSAEQAYRWIMDNRLHVCHWVTVNDLMHLKRGGRVSAATALVGTMLQIKPVLIMDESGHLDTAAKARGRKGAMAELLRMARETALPGENDTVLVGHGDCPQEAQTLAEELQRICGAKRVITTYVGNVIGSHTGPDVLVIAYLGTSRRGS